MSRSDDDDRVAQAFQDLREAYRLLNDPSRDEEMNATIYFAHTVLKWSRAEVVVDWLYRQAALVRQEAEG